MTMLIRHCFLTGTLDVSEGCVKTNQNIYLRQKVLGHFSECHTFNQDF